MKFKPDKKQLLNMLLYLSVIVLGIAFDQLTKLLAVLYLKGEPSINIIGRFLRLSYVENTGMAFGMMKNSRWVFMTVSTVAIVAMLIFLFFVKEQKKLYSIPIALIASGGIGNMIDRIALGYVIDFVDVKGFAVFNGADSLVCVGAGILMLALILDIVKEGREKKEQNKKDGAE